MQNTTVHLKSCLICPWFLAFVNMLNITTWQHANRLLNVTIQLIWYDWDFFSIQQRERKISQYEFKKSSKNSSSCWLCLLLSPKFQSANTVPVAVCPRWGQWSTHGSGEHGWQDSLDILSHVGLATGEQWGTPIHPKMIVRKPWILGTQPLRHRKLPPPKGCCSFPGRCWPASENAITVSHKSIAIVQRYISHFRREPTNLGVHNFRYTPYARWLCMDMHGSLTLQHQLGAISLPTQRFEVTPIRKASSNDMLPAPSNPPRCTVKAITNYKLK